MSSNDSNAVLVTKITYVLGAPRDSPHPGCPIWGPISSFWEGQRATRNQLAFKTLWFGFCFNLSREGYLLVHVTKRSRGYSGTVGSKDTNIVIRTRLSIICLRVPLYCLHSLAHFGMVGPLGLSFSSYRAKQPQYRGSGLLLHSSLELLRFSNTGPTWGKKKQNPLWQQNTPSFE